jgi:hypothetical protein
VAQHKSVEIKIIVLIVMILKFKSLYLVFKKVLFGKEPIFRLFQSSLQKYVKNFKSPTISDDFFKGTPKNLQRHAELVSASPYFSRDCG